MSYLKVQRVFAEARERASRQGSSIGKLSATTMSFWPSTTVGIITTQKWPCQHHDERIVSTLRALASELRQIDRRVVTAGFNYVRFIVSTSIDCGVSERILNDAGSMRSLCTKSNGIPR